MKDYWASIVSDGGQETLFANDYAQLPSSILNIARNGVNAVCWDKPGTGAVPDACATATRGRRAPRRCGSRWCRRTTSARAPNRTHGPPLAFPSCNPPVQSVRLSDGRLAGRERCRGELDRVRRSTRSIAGDRRPAADDADVTITVSITDVRNKVGLADYTGQVQVTLHGADHRPR